MFVYISLAVFNNVFFVMLHITINLMMIKSRHHSNISIKVMALTSSLLVLMSAALIGLTIYFLALA